MKTTSSAVISSPLWNLTPWRSFSSTVWSSMRRHSVASPGTASRLPRQFLEIRPSQIEEKNTRSPTFDCSRSTSSVFEFVTFCTAIVTDGRLSACPIAKRGKTSVPAARRQAQDGATGGTDHTIAPLHGTTTMCTEIGAVVVARIADLSLSGQARGDACSTIHRETERGQMRCPARTFA